MSNNTNNRSRSSSLPPLRQIPVRAPALPQTSSPIMEQVGEPDLNSRMSAMETMLQTIISALPIQGNANVTTTTTPLSEPVSDLAAPTITQPSIANDIDRREVNKKHFTTTSTSVMAVFKENKINSTCRDSFARISMIRGALSTANLRNMLDGYRKMPIVTTNNIYGYSERRTVIGIETDFITGSNRSVDIRLEEDDVYYYEHDKGRLFMAVTEMFHDDLRYLVPQEIENCDGVAIYVKIMEHLNGQRERDVDAAKEALNKYKMNESITFKQEKAKFEEIFKTLEYAQRSKMKDSEKIQFLTSRLVNDKRVGLRDVIIQARLGFLSYDQTVENLIRLNTEMSDTNQTVKMAGMYSPKSNKQTTNSNDISKIKYCYNFNESGECRFGASCIYSHDKDPNHVTREPRPKKTEIKPSHPNQVGKDHRTPNGGEKFHGGYKSKSNKVKFKKTSSSEDNTCLKSMTVNNESILDHPHSSFEPFKSWSNVDQKPMIKTCQSQNIITMKMMQENQSFLSEQDSHFPDDQNDPEVHVERTSDFANRFQTIQPIHELQLQHCRRSNGNPMGSLQAVHEMETLHQMLFFHRNFVHFKYPSNVEYEAPIEQGGLISKFTGFKWNPRSSTSGTIVEEIRNPTGSVMELIYRVNEKFMGATLVHATPIIPVSVHHAGNFNIAQYSTFRKMGSKEGKPGYYKSSMTDLNGYISILAKIKSESDNPNLETGDIYIGESTCQLMIWCVVYDFMSFCTYLYGSNYETSEQSIQDSRNELSSEIEQHRHREFEYRGLKNVFLSIAKCANGILENTFIPKMINNPDIDSENENDLNSDHSDTESEDSNTKSENKVTDHPAHKRHCNRMSTFGQHK